MKPKRKATKKGTKKMATKGEAAKTGNADARAFIENFGKNAPHPEAMNGRYTFQNGDGFVQGELDVADGWYTDGIWSVRFADGKATEAVRSDIEKPEDASPVNA